MSLVMVATMFSEGMNVDGLMVRSMHGKNKFILEEKTTKIKSFIG